MLKRTKMPKLERDNEAYLKRRVKQLGGEVRKVKWIGRSHAPDRLVLLPDAHFFIELKRPGQRPSEAQRREHTRMRAAGMIVRWADCPALIDQLLER